MSELSPKINQEWLLRARAVGVGALAAFALGGNASADVNNGTAQPVISAPRYPSSANAAYRAELNERTKQLNGWLRLGRHGHCEPIDGNVVAHWVHNGVEKSAPQPFREVINGLPQYWFAKKVGRRIKAEPIPQYEYVGVTESKFALSPDSRAGQVLRGHENAVLTSCAHVILNHRTNKPSARVRLEHLGHIKSGLRSIRIGGPVESFAEPPTPGVVG
jgi:hypothetical protein